MSGPFVELTESETGRPLLVNVDRVLCVAPHGRGGAFVYLSGSPERMEIDETPARVAEILAAAGVMASQGERRE
ncbi:MAG: hypothetical protein IT306_20765 [Chloroflexi bacterium]|nr:hypothetical protein [Chloroflexota bacterium]